MEKFLAKTSQKIAKEPNVGCEGESDKISAWMMTTHSWNVASQSILQELVKRISPPLRPEDLKSLTADLSEFTYLLK